MAESMELEKKEGIVVKSFNYQENKRIITVFTESGLLSLIATLHQKNPSLQLLTTPLCIGEFFYKKTSKQLYSLKEGSILSSYQNYNTSYPHIETAFSFLQTLLASQLPEKPAPLLYKLLKLYLEKLPSFQSPKTLSSSFILKTLRHEGLLPLEGLCSSCETLPTQAFFQKEPFCKTCMPAHSLFFEEKEWEQFQVLLFSKDLKKLESLSYEEGFHQKIHALLKESVE